jgi:hypothetical protein
MPIINSVNFKEDLLKLTSLLDANKKIKIIEITRAKLKKLVESAEYLRTKY